MGVCGAHGHAETRGDAFQASSAKNEGQDFTFARGERGALGTLRAVDDHQTKNAQAMVSAGAARLVAEGDDFVKRLGKEFEEIGERARLLRMANAARALAKPDAARRIAEICLEAGA